jgi:hypothetical protein
MVSKGNNNRKKSIKTEKPQKEEIPVANVVDTITQTVVGVLKPDLDKKIEAINQSINQIGESLKNQLVNEIKDIRSQIPQPQTQPSDEQNAETLAQPESPLEQPQQTPLFMGIPVDIIMQAALRLFAPKPADNSAMVNTFQQATIRKSMANEVFDDWFMKMYKQKMAKELLHMEIPPEVQAGQDQYMKPLRDVGINALKREEEEKRQRQLNKMHQQSEEKHEL